MVTKKEVDCYMSQIQDHERVNLELQSTYYLKNVELIYIHNDLTHLQKVANRLKSEEVELQDALFANENLENELDELQHARTRLVEENEQLMSEKVGLEFTVAQGQTDFYKLGYVDHLQGRLSDYEFSEKGFKTFPTSPHNLLAFSLEAAVGRAIDDGAALIRAAEDEMLEGVIAKSGAAAKCMVTKSKNVQAAD